MELTSQVLRQVQFDTEFRGYKTAEVDDLLESAAIAVDQLHEDLASLTERAERAERALEERSERSGSSEDDEESIRRTLVLAQRTADLAIKEAQEEAAQRLDAARRDAEAMLSEARQAAEQVVTDADRNLREEVGRLVAERDRLRGEIEALLSLLAAERERLTESLSATLRFVEKNLLPSPEVSALSAAGASAAQAPQSAVAPQRNMAESAAERAASLVAAAPKPPAERDLPEPDVDDLEAAIAADAAAAAPSLGEIARPSLAAVPDAPDSEEDVPGAPDGSGDEPTRRWKFGKAGSIPS